jgi:hypothetical protein
MPLIVLAALGLPDFSTLTTQRKVDFWAVVILTLVYAVGCALILGYNLPEN